MSKIENSPKHLEEVAARKEATKEMEINAEKVTAFHQPLVDWLNEQKGKPLTESQWHLINKVRYFTNKYHAQHKQLSAAFKDV